MKRKYEENMRSLIFSLIRKSHGIKEDAGWIRIQGVTIDFLAGSRYFIRIKGKKFYDVPFNPIMLEFMRLLAGQFERRVSYENGVFILYRKKKHPSNSFTFTYNVLYGDELDGDEFFRNKKQARKEEEQEKEDQENRNIELDLNWDSYRKS